jgi:hypothetical protein
VPGLAPSIHVFRKFRNLPAARAKPVLVVKSGRNGQGAKAAQTHTGALAGSDAVYDAAFCRTGLLRVLDLDELLAAAETLGHLTTLAGDRLAILTNGVGVQRRGPSDQCADRTRLADRRSEMQSFFEVTTINDAVISQFCLGRTHCKPCPHHLHERAFSLSFAESGASLAKARRAQRAFEELSAR